MTKEAKDYIAELGFSPVYGARPLKRAIQKQLLDTMALRILEGSIKEGDTVTVDFVRDQGLTFSTSKS